MKRWYSRHKDVVLEINRKSVIKNKDKVSLRSKLYVERNREKIRLIKRRYKERHRDRLRVVNREYMRKKISSDPIFKIHRRISKQVWSFLKQSSGKNNRKSVDLLGYSPEELCSHLESLFTDKMNWGNYGKYWEIDHIVPISKMNDKPVKEVWALKNLQPLSIFENRSKGNRIGVLKS